MFCLQLKIKLCFHPRSKLLAACHFPIGPTHFFNFIPNLKLRFRSSFKITFLPQLKIKL
ncbi:hypothetical protein Hanom_Chr16g01473701 [Helianthus anomalus]